MRENIHKVKRQQNAYFLFEELRTPSVQELDIICKYVIKFALSLCPHPFFFSIKIDCRRCGLKIPVVSASCSKEAIRFPIPAA